MFLNELNENNEYTSDLLNKLEGSITNEKCSNLSEKINELNSIKSDLNNLNTKNTRYFHQVKHFSDFNNRFVEHIENLIKNKKNNTELKRDIALTELENKINELNKLYNDRQNVDTQEDNIVCNINMASWRQIICLANGISLNVVPFSAETKIIHYIIKEMDTI